jgi:hypothetical protein
MVPNGLTLRAFISATDVPTALAIVATQVGRKLFPLEPDVWISNAQDIPATRDSIPL